jgi:hypothetical protein
MRARSVQLKETNHPLLVSGRVAEKQKLIIDRKDGKFFIVTREKGVNNSSLSITNRVIAI